MEARDQAIGVEVETQWRLKRSVPRMDGSLELPLDYPDTDNEPKGLGDSHAPTREERRGAGARSKARRRLHTKDLQDPDQHQEDRG